MPLHPPPSDPPEGGGLSRRSFLKTMSASAAGTAVLLHMPGGEAAAEEEPHGDRQLLELTVNGRAHRFLVAPRTTLLEVIRDQLGLTGTKMTCNRGMCGACTVLLNGKAVYSCHMLALDADGGEVTTVEGLLQGEKLSDLQKAFEREDGLQCGFCTPGQVMAAAALLREHPRPSREQILTGMSGNLCRCSAYPKIVKAVESAAGGK